MTPKKMPEIVAPEMVSYLEHMLDLARKGRVLYLMAAAGTVDPEDPGELMVHVGACLSGHSQMLDERSLRAGLEATNTGLVKAAELAFQAVNEEMEYRKPRILM